MISSHMLIEMTTDMQPTFSVAQLNQLFFFSKISRETFIRATHFVYSVSISSLFWRGFWFALVDNVWYTVHRNVYDWFRVIKSINSMRFHFETVKNQTHLHFPNIKHDRRITPRTVILNQNQKLDHSNSSRWLTPISIVSFFQQRQSNLFDCQT